MSAETPSVDIDRLLTEARQSLMLLKSQAQARQIDPAYFAERLERLSGTLDTLAANRRQYADAERFTKLYQVSRAIGSSLDLQTVLNSVMDAIIALTGAERGFLMLLNDDGVLEVRIARNFDQETLESGEFAVSRTINKQVFESGEPVVTTNAAEDPRYAGQQSIVAHQLRSIMAAPLRARGANIGVIYVDSRIRTGLFREADLELLEAFAGQAAVAIDNARLFAETDQKLAQRVEELKTLQWIDRQLAEHLDLRKAMDLTVEWAMRMCKAQSASLAMLSKGEPPVLEILSHAGQTTELLGLSKTLDRQHPLVVKVFESQQTALHSTEEETLMCVPIHRENQIVGLITVQRESPFDADEQALVARMADRAAIAIENGRLYTELQAANKAKSEFVGVVAHELKVPMTSIRGYADLLSQFQALDERGQDFANRIKGAVVRMQTLVEDLSDISRIESGNLRVQMTEVDLQEVLEVAKTSTMGQIEERGHKYSEDLLQPAPKLKADPARLSQVLINLLSNAYKYTPNNGQIAVKTWKQGERVFISVKDSGVGLSEQELRKLGTKFWRSDNEHTLKQSGTGLGFSITRQLIELMDGTLDIQSVVGQGSTFTLSFKVS